MDRPDDGHGARAWPSRVTGIVNRGSVPAPPRARSQELGGGVRLRARGAPARVRGHVERGAEPLAP
jgi:hypothetical protein